MIGGIMYATYSTTTNNFKTGPMRLPFKSIAGIHLFPSESFTLFTSWLGFDGLEKDETP